MLSKAVLLPVHSFFQWVEGAKGLIHSFRNKLPGIILKGTS